MLPGGGNSSGGQDWTDEALYRQNSDWVVSTSAPPFELQYATGPQAVQSPLQLAITSAEPELTPLRAGGTGAYPSFDHGRSWSFDDEYQGNLYGWPGAPPAPSAFNVPSAQSVGDPARVEDVHDPSTRPLIGSLNAFTGGIGPDPGRQTAQPDYASHTSFLPFPTIDEATESPPAARTVTRSHTVAQETPSAAQAPQTASRKLTRSQTLSPSSAQASPTRKRRAGPRSPLARQPLPKAPFHPNEEEEARRIHMASVSGGGSLPSNASRRSRGANEQENAGTEENLRIAESKKRENLGAGRTPGVLRTPLSGDDSSEQFSLPPGKGFPIQIGSELFRLSGASIMSDCQRPRSL